MKYHIYYEIRFVKEHRFIEGTIDINYKSKFDDIEILKEKVKNKIDKSLTFFESFTEPKDTDIDFVCFDVSSI